MTDEVARLDFATNVGDVTAQVARALQQLQSDLEAAGRASGGNVGGQVIDGLGRVIQIADNAGASIQTLFTQIVEGSKKLGDIQGPQTLGGMVTKIVSELRSAEEQFRSTPGASDILGGAIQRQIGLLEQLKQQALAAKEVLGSLNAPQAGELARFASGQQISRATNLAAPYLPVPVSDANPGPTAEEILASQRHQGVEKLDQAAQGAGQSVHDLKVFLDTLIHAGIAQIDSKGIVRADLNGVRVEERYPSQLPGAEAPEGVGNADLARIADVRRAEESAYRDEESRLAQAQRDSLSLTRQQQSVTRAHQAALDEQAKANDLARQQSLRAQQLSGAEGFSRIGKSAFYQTPDGLSQLTPNGLDSQLDQKRLQQAVDAMVRAGAEVPAQYEQLAAASRASIAAEKQKQTAEEAYTQLLDQSNLQGLHLDNPGVRELAGGAYFQMNDMLLKRTAAGYEEITATQDLYRAELALARELASQQRVGAVATKSPFDALLGGAFGHGFDSHQSFDPKNAINNLAATAGVLARYGYEFKLIQAALDGVKTSFQDLSTFQQNMIDLDAAIKATGADSLNLDEAFSEAGSSALAANDAYAIGTQALQAYQDELRAGTDVNVIFQRSVEAVGQAVLLTGQNAQQAQQNLIASTNSFQLGSAGQQRILDSVVNAVHNYGGNRSDILDALSTSSAAAQEAGVSPEELANIVALIQSRTGDNGSTIAQSFDRLVSRQDNQQFREGLSRLGIQDTGDVTQEIQDMSQAYNKLTTSEQQAFIVQLGGSRNLKDLLPLLRDGGDLMEKNSKSTRNSGAAAEEAQKQLNSLGGQLKQIHALLGDILTNVGRSGAFEALGIGIEVLRPALAGVNTLLTTFNSLLGAIPAAQPVLGIAASVILLGKAIELYRVKVGANAAQAEQSAADERSTSLARANAVATQAQTEAIAAGADARQAAAAASAAYTRALATEADVVNADTAALVRRDAALIPTGAGSDLRTAGNVATAEAPLAAERAGVLGAARLGGGAILGSLTSPVTLAIGGLFAVGEIGSHADGLSKAMDDATSSLHGLGTAKTASQWQTIADNLKQDAEAQHKAAGGIFGHVSTFLFGGDDESGIKQQAAFAAEMAKRIASDGGSSSTLSGVFGSTGHDLATGLQAMKDQGIPASLQLRAVADALGLVKANADSAAGSLAYVQGQPKGLAFSQSLVGGLSAAFGNDATGLYTKGKNGQLVGPAGGSPVFSPEEIAKTVTSTLQGKQTGDLLTDEDKQKVADTVAQKYYLRAMLPQGEDASQSEASKLRDYVRQKVLGYLSSQTLAAVQQQTGPIDDTTLQGMLPNLQALAQGTQGNPLELGSQTSQLSLLLATLNNQKNRAADKHGVGYAGLIELIDQVESQYVQARVGDLERLRQAAEKRAGGNIAGIKSIREDYFGREIDASKNSTVELTNIFDQMTQGEINLFLAKYKEEVDLAREALRSEERLLSAIAGTPGLDGLEGQKQLQGQSKAVIAARNKYNNILDTYKNLLGGNKNASPQDSITSDSAVASAEQTHIAYLNSLADPRNSVSQAQTALNVARYQLSVASKGSADYYTAVKAVNDAEYQLAQATEQRSAAIAQAKVFPGSQLEQAASEIKTAKDELAIAEQGTADWYKAMGDLQKAQVDYAKAVMDYHHNLRLLKIDVTDPVAMAKEQLRQDRAQLDHDQANGAPNDIIAGDKVKLKQDTAAKENAAFSQKMQDEQTAYDLQDISADAYLRFLDHQRQRLQQIHHKTRQQIDELNQVDQAIKGLADGMNGQFNLGDIKVPTPYEARRYLASKVAGVGYDAQSSDAAAGGPMSLTTVNNHVNVTIHGGDVKKLEEVLKKHFQNASDRHGTKPRRI